MYPEESEKKATSELVVEHEHTILIAEVYFHNLQIFSLYYNKCTSK